MSKVLFENSKTKINLLKAFAGESQARNRYTFAASQAKKEGFQVIEKIFNFTADQEKEHAKLFYSKLAKFGGNTIHIEGDYPIDIYSSTLDLLKHATQNEYEEYKDVYKSFGDEAGEEGFEEIKNLFYNVAEIEKVHGDRFLKVSSLIESNELFESSSEEKWFCLNCGSIHIGKKAPQECEVCNHGQGYFIRSNWILV